MTELLLEARTHTPDKQDDAADLILQRIELPVIET